MRGFSEIGMAIKNIFSPFQWIIIPEVILLFLLIYFVLKTLYENNAKRLIPVYIALVVASGGISIFIEQYGAIIFFITFMAFSMFFLLLFSVEIKRMVWNTVKRTVSGSASPTRTTVASVRADEYISGIVKAVQNLSKNNIGALIVLSNGNLPKAIVESGVTLNSKISSQLIEGIFIPKAPLHDGAMIILGDKIQAAGCFLPLTQKEFPKDYGTRHRAGIGVTEIADVSAIIVSEETGIVSTVKRGEITRYVDSENLKRFLKEYYWKEFNAEAKK